MFEDVFGKIHIQLPKTLSYKAITCPTNPEDVNQFICCGRDNKAYPERKRMIAGKWDGG